VKSSAAKEIQATSDGLHEVRVRRGAERTHAILKSSCLSVPERTNSNTLAVEDYSVHAWYRFVLSYPPHLVRKYMQAFRLRNHQVVLDPFCGTGTTLVEAKKHGIQSIGIDAHPFAAFVSRVKTCWSLSLPKLGRLRKALFLEIARANDAENLNRISFDDLLVEDQEGGLQSILELTPDELKLIPTGFMSPRPMQRLLIVRKCIYELCRDEAQDTRDFFLLCLCHVVANGAGNFAFGPEIYRTKQKPDYDVLGHYVRQLDLMFRDLALVQANSQKEGAACVFCRDARDCSFLESSIDAVITSPPYPNEKDYTRTTRVEAVLLGMITSRESLRTVKEWLVRSNTRNVFVGDDDSKEVAGFDSIQNVCQAIEQRRVDLCKTSGFERLYHKVVAHYFGGMRRHLRTLHPLLSRRAKLAYVVGDQLSFLMVPVRTATLLAEIATTEGYRVIGIDLWRERLGTRVCNAVNGQTTVKVREEVLMLEKC